ncbi:MAG: ATP-dependent DNA helicase RecQ [Bacteroidales bacterium]|nr:ATP-dependent DNA helicase RecQ [Bacteroidales bacterium]MBR4647590.1 ATP-dependent DNA helicase RecQ [Bacteroidales bacterium]
MKYKEEISLAQARSFDSFKDIAKGYIMSLSESERKELYDSLDRGVNLLETDAQLKCYLFSFGKMHQAKINEVLPHIDISEFQNTDIQIVDWGCGQALATICMFDYFNQHSISLDSVKRVTLIEPSPSALERACIHVGAYINDDKVIPINKYLDEVDTEEIESTQPVTIHLFSNILDIPTIDLQLLANKIKKSLLGKHYFICLGPLNAGNNRIDIFYDYFSEATKIFENVHNKQEYDSQGNLINSYSYTAKNRVFLVDGNSCELIFVDYYLPKQFHAAFQLDAVRKVLNNGDYADKLQGLYRNLSEFEVQTPFDIGASIYDDVNPIFAVLNNVVTRGLPTKASPFIEDVFKSFGNKRIEDELGSINYQINDIKSDDLFMAMHLVDSRWKISADNYNCKVLDSDLEKAFITRTCSPVITQLMQPQRDLSTITNEVWHRSQRVDFAFEYPYSTKDRNGCVIEIDGIKYHSRPVQVLSDQQRKEALDVARWYGIRLNENEIRKNLKTLGSEYVGLTQTVFEREFDSNWVNTLQLVLSPIAVARLEKTILEALMIGKLDINAKKWEVLAIEHDVPCAALAFEDLKQMFTHLTQLSVDYSNLTFPEVDLTIVSSEEFAQSDLHLSKTTQSIGYKSTMEFDIVIDCAVLRRAGLEKIDFTQYRCKNQCYFNIRSAHYHRNERHIYTSDRIQYLPIVRSNTQGRYDDIKENVEHLQYFLQLLFRKQDFRPGQTPILSRALQNKSVIGLLPTGGGKSLTYQIAAMLQPGVTLVVDPLRSLMKDQYDGLISAGIDSCTYINSAIEVPDRITGKREVERYRTEERERRAKQMEMSELQFVFLSPERLSILDFRERLKNMHETGVYFSYGVIDEVHCVSEWGHDFRFSYLHLGRNLYQYVLPKQIEGESGHIPLFGLTATASFDVLADVERELSGNGAFLLDSDTIIRDGNTNRFELQYKIEPVNVAFKDKNGFLRPDKWAIYDSKKDALDGLISKIPNYLNQLLSSESIETIQKGYSDGSPRQDDKIKSASLFVDIPSEMLYPADSYDYGGIVFCPHRGKLFNVFPQAINVNNFLSSCVITGTGLAVYINAKNLSNYHPETKVGTFVGSDDATLGIPHIDEDKISFANLERFRDNKIPLMIATKAFGMGIDKPNVRYTINMNYSSSLESFVQEAGRAGRDRKMALSTIMFSKYKIARVKPESAHYKNNVKDKWFDGNDLQGLSENLNIPISEFEVCDETTDLVKLKCKQCGDGCKRFEQNCCAYSCQSANAGICSVYNAKIQQPNYNPQDDNCLQACEFYGNCPMSKVPTQDRWEHYEHLEVLKKKYDFLTVENYEFLNADYETVIYFHNSNFKGEMIEEKQWKDLLNERLMDVFCDDDKVGNSVQGFFSTLESRKDGDKVTSLILYSKKEYADIAKAIYRMCCIELIDDFTQDYGKDVFRIVSVKKADGKYYDALEKYLRRYYSEERAKELMKEVPDYKGENEIHKCLGYLTHFIYDKIAVKRKRAIDDMHAFCLRGISNQKDWKEINEELKDELYFYFNSKYARKGYQTITNNPYSLTDDTEGGKIFSTELLFKYLKVVDRDFIEKESEPGTAQIDNIKHLHGAVRLIRRSLTDENPTLSLLNAFCLLFLDVKDNERLREEMVKSYIEGMTIFYETSDNKLFFWKQVFDKFNEIVSPYTDKEALKSFAEQAALYIHANEIDNITKKYLS